MRSGPTTGVLIVALYGLAPGAALSAQEAATEPAYVTRGHQTEARQGAYHTRIERLHETLTAVLQAVAPDQIDILAPPPPPDIYGYQLGTQLRPDGLPLPSGSKSQVVSYSWRWSDTLIDRELKTIERIEAALALVPRSTEGRAAVERLASDYRQAVANRKTIDSDIAYNWNWQEQIAGNRPLFDRLQRTQQEVLDREAIGRALASGDESRWRAAAARASLAATVSAGTAQQLRAALEERVHSLTGEISAATNWAAPPPFLRVERPGPRQVLVTLTLYTDITDAAFVDGVVRAVETLWHVSRPGPQGPEGDQDLRLRIEVQTISPHRLYCEDPVGTCAPPAEGAHIDVDAHVGRFPRGGAILTTGAPLLRLVGDRAVVLGPDGVSAHVLAHEFGHLIGIPDAYFRGYRDAGPDGFVITELADLDDIMGAPGAGPVLARHFDMLIAGQAKGLLNESLTLYQQQRYADALDAARRAVGLDRRFAEAYNNMAVAFAGLALWDEAVAAAEEAVRLKPDFELAKNNLAWVREERTKAGAERTPGR